MLRVRTRVLPAIGAALAVSLFAAAPLGAAVRPAVADPVADYQFQNVRTSSTGGPALVDIGKKANVFATETVDGASHTVLTFTAHHGVSLSPTTGLVSSTEYSIVVLARLKLIDGYRRLIDFKNGTVDTGLYQDNGSLDFYSDGNGTKTPIKKNQYFQVVLTRDTATKTIVGYVDGAQQFSFKDTANDGVINARNTLRFFSDDKAVPGEDSAGAVARIRLYNTVLSAADVAALDREPLG